MRLEPTSPPGWWSAGLLGALLVTHTAFAAPARTLLPRPALGGATCVGAIQHPIDVRITALDPIRRGATLRLAVRATSAVTLANAEIQLVHLGGAVARGARAARLGRVAANDTRVAEFEVQVPERGTRTLLQFRITGEGPTGRLARGATYNVLPDGPADPGREITTPEGTKLIQFGARRIDL